MVDNKRKLDFEFVHRAAGKFIVDTVITIVLEGIKTFVTSVFKSIAVTLGFILPGLEIISLSPLVLQVHDKQVQFSMTIRNSDLILSFGEIVVEIPRILTQTSHLETLGLQEFVNFFKLVSITSLIEGGVLLFFRSFMDKPQPPSVKLGMIGLFIAVANTVAGIWKSRSFSPEMKGYLAQFHLFVATSMLNVWAVEFPKLNSFSHVIKAMVAAILIEQTNVVFRAMFAGVNFMEELLLLTAELIGSVIGRLWAKILIVNPRTPMMAIELLGYFLTTYLFHLLLSSYFEFWGAWQ